jgi:hypothetical protein
VTETELDALTTDVEAEIAAPGRRGLTYTVVQTWATVP